MSVDLSVLSVRQRTSEGGRQIRWWWVWLLAPAALILWTYRTLDLRDVVGAVSGVGPLLLLALAPFLLAMLLDSLAWKGLLANLGYRVGLGQLFPLRVSTEALCAALPGGPFLADGLSPVLLRRRRDVPVSAGLASMTARKCLLCLAQAIYVGLGAVLGYSFLRRVSAQVIRAGGLPWLLAAISGLLFLLAAALLAAVFSGSVAGHLGRRLARWPLGPVRGWWRRLGAPAREIDGELARSLGAQRHQLLGPLALYLLVWMTEVGETLLILRLLGVPLGFPEACAIEPAVRCLRYAAFFIPAGCGVQELGYLLFFRGAGLSDPLTTSAAFSLLKRTRELLCVAAGLVGLALLERRVIRPVTALEVGP